MKQVKQIQSILFLWFLVVTIASCGGNETTRMAITPPAIVGRWASFEPEGVIIEFHQEGMFNSIYGASGTYTIDHETKQLILVFDEWCGEAMVSRLLDKHRVYPLCAAYMRAAQSDENPEYIFQYTVIDDELHLTSEHISIVLNRSSHPEKLLGQWINFEEGISIVFADDGHFNFDIPIDHSRRELGYALNSSIIMLTFDDRAYDAVVEYTIIDDELTLTTVDGDSIVFTYIPTDPTLTDEEAILGEWARPNDDTVLVFNDDGTVIRQNKSTNEETYILDGTTKELQFADDINTRMLTYVLAGNQLNLIEGDDVITWFRVIEVDPNQLVGFWQGTHEFDSGITNPYVYELRPDRMIYKDIYIDHSQKTYSFYEDSAPWEVEGNIYREMVEGEEQFELVILDLTEDTITLMDEGGEVFVETRTSGLILPDPPEGYREVNGP